MRNAPLATDCAVSAAVCAAACALSAAACAAATMSLGLGTLLAIYQLCRTFIGLSSLWSIGCPLQRNAIEGE
jgi:hypothetical protein